MFEENQTKNDGFTLTFYVDCEGAGIKIDSCSLEITIELKTKKKCYAVQAKDYDQSIQFLKCVYGFQTKRKKVVI